MFRKIFIVVFFVLSFILFYKINEINYEKHNEIKQSFIEHPDKLPKKDFAKATSFGFQNLKADYYWLMTVQYIGGNAFHSEYKAYLFQILDLITDLNPFFESPYIVGQLLLPGYEPMYEKITEKENEIHVDEAIELGLKGVSNFCKPDIIEKINKEEDLIKLWEEGNYENPCLTYRIPFYLAYVYFFYKNDPVSSAKYYKIASATHDSPDGAKTMAAIMPGKGGNREKSFFMFLSLAKHLDPNNDVCNVFSHELENIGYGIFKTEEIKLDSKLLMNINKLREETLGIDDGSEDYTSRSTNCGHYINKAVRELNLFYLDEANKKFIEDKGFTSEIATQLQEEGYIDYLPQDHQQYEDYGIIYILNKNTGNYDYMLGNY